MKLRVRINRQTSRLEVPGEDPGLTELQDLIRDSLLPDHGLGADTQFSLSLNGSELLSDSGQTLSSCGIVSGDLLCVVLPQSAAATATNAANAANASSSSSSSSSSSRTSRGPENQQNQQNQQTGSMTSNQPSRSSSGPAACSGPEVASCSEEAACIDEEAAAAAAAPHWEPMLCSEAQRGQAPLSLEILHHSAQPNAAPDAIMVAGHLMMLETGFVPQGVLCPGSMPAGWRSSSGVFRFSYSHPLCEGSVALVVAVSMGTTLVINATLKVNDVSDAVRKICVTPQSFVTDRCSESAAAAFRDLNKLSRLFKDQLAYPLIAAAREAMALPVAFGLAALPPELLLRVVRLLDVRSVVRLSSVCRRFNTSINDSTIWRNLTRRDFNDRDLSRSRDTDWRELYRRFYQLRSERLQSFRRRSLPVPVPPLPRPFGPFSPFGPVGPGAPLVPGIIGGEYDQRPALHHVFPRPRHDPLGPLGPHGPLGPFGPDGRPARSRWAGGRPADVRRGFI